MTKGKAKAGKSQTTAAGAAFVNEEASAFADAVVEFGIQTFQRKERERQYQQEVTYAHKREIARQPKDPNGHTWTDGEFSQVYRHGESSSDLAHLRLVALKHLGERLDFVQRLVENAIDEMPSPKSNAAIGAGAQLAGALAILRQERPMYISDVRIWSSDHLCAICNCSLCRKRMEYIESQRNGSNQNQVVVTKCCKHEDASLFLPF